MPTFTLPTKPAAKPDPAAGKVEKLLATSEGRQLLWALIERFPGKTLVELAAMAARSFKRT